MRAGTDRLDGGGGWLGRADAGVVGGPAASGDDWSRGGRRAADVAAHHLLSQLTTQRQVSPLNAQVKRRNEAMKQYGG